MEQLRFNAFNQIHKGLRALMYHTALAIQHADFNDAAQAEEVYKKVEEVIHLFEEHAHVEDTVIFPLLNDIAPEVVANFEQQHVRDHELGEELSQALQQVKAAANPIQTALAARKLQAAFTEFVAFNLSHMNQEETIVNEQFWAHFSDEELIATVKKLVASFPPEKNAKDGYWMLKGLSMNEIIFWFTDMKNNAPSFVLDMMMGVAEKALSEHKYAQLQEALGLAIA